MKVYTHCSLEQQNKLSGIMHFIHYNVINTISLKNEPLEWLHGRKLWKKVKRITFTYFCFSSQYLLYSLCAFFLALPSCLDFNLFSDVEDLHLKLIKEHLLRCNFFIRDTEVKSGTYYHRCQKIFFNKRRMVWICLPLNTQ